jgi:hypothetical protein
MSPDEYEAKKEAVADEICARLEKLWPGLRAAIEFREVSGSSSVWRYCYNMLECCRVERIRNCLRFYCYRLCSPVAAGTAV